MKPILSLLLLCTCLQWANAQAIQYAYRVQFTDKNGSNFSLQNPEAYLSDRALSRREKYNINTDSLDLPVVQSYIDSVLELSSGILHCKSKWLNQCVILVSDTNDVNNLATLDFVYALKRVGVFPFGLHQKPGAGTAAVLDETDTNFYAAAWKQIHLCNGEYLHQQGFMGEGMLIAVLDVGFVNADALNAFDSLFQGNRLADQFNFKLNNTDVFGSGNHGTNVLSCMAAFSPEVFVGTAPKAQYALYATDDASTEFSIEMDNWIAAAERADSIGADLISSSLGYNTFDDTENSYAYEQLDGHTTPIALAADIAVQKGILVVISAGNEGNTPWQHILTPGDAEKVLTVGSVNDQKSVASTSGKGPNAAGLLKPDVCALGVQAAVISSGSGQPTTQTGASFATPVLAGLAACLMQAAPQKTPEEIKSLLHSVSDHYANSDNHIGYGVPDFMQALQLVGVKEVIAGADCRIYPNPVRHTLFITLPAAWNNSRIPVAVWDAMGRMLPTPAVHRKEGGMELDVSGMTPGVYRLRLDTPEGLQAVSFVKL